MKKLMLKMGGAVASLALMVVAMNVNAACMFVMHQPELPEGASKLRKF